MELVPQAYSLRADILFFAFLTFAIKYAVGFGFPHLPIFVLSS